LDFAQVIKRHTADTKQFTQPLAEGTHGSVLTTDDCFALFSLAVKNIFYLFYSSALSIAVAGGIIFLCCSSICACVLW